MIVGHKSIIEDLQKLTEHGRLSHGYVFFGPAMVGKRTVARSFANFLETGEFAEPLAASGVEPKLLQDGLLIKPDEKGTLGIDAVRTLKGFLWQKPNMSERRTAIIDGGEFLTTEAQNALLKIAEEPPASSLLILVTSDVDALLPTIPSRLQRVYFPIIPQKLIEEWLVGDHGATKKSATDAAQASFGKPGLAYALLNDKSFQATLKSAESLLKLSGAYSETPYSASTPIFSAANPSSLLGVAQATPSSDFGALARKSRHVATKEGFRTSSDEKRRDFIKKLLDDENFNFVKFMDALIIHLASDKIYEKNNIARWHKFLALREEIAYFNLNPRLQLENLLIANELTS